MEKIYQHVEDIVTLAEVQDGFYEVEITVLIRRDGGRENDFVRMQLENFDGEKKTRQLTVKSASCPKHQWF
jgi:flagella basal body P-ring formation protein FlgA